MASTHVSGLGMKKREENECRKLAVSGGRVISGSKSTQSKCMKRE